MKTKIKASLREVEHVSKAQNALLVAVDDELGEDEQADAPSACNRLNRLFLPTKRSDTLIPGHSMKEQHCLLLETIEGFNKASARRFFHGLGSYVNAITRDEAYVPESAFEDDDNEDETSSIPAEHSDITPDKTSTECLHFLKFSAMCVDAYIRGQEERAAKKVTAQTLSIIAEVYGVALSLHNVLFSLQSCGDEGLATQDTILSLCESWWHYNASQRENLIVQCLPLMVLQALDDENFRKSYIKRIFQLKEAFQIIDYTNQCSDSLRSLLQRLTSNPLCLRMTEGKRFLASLFQEPSLTRDLHSAIQAQISEAKESVLKAYGEVYLRAWNDAVDSPEARDALEQKALQQLVHASIHLASTGVVKSIHTLLEPMRSKKTADIEGLFHRLYSPIIWRSLRSANAQVRVNAITALGHVFPLQDGSHTQTQGAIAKGTEALGCALRDSDHRVRVASSAATATVCAVFWDVLPAEDIRLLLNHIVMEHASDKSSSFVRAGALEAVTTLLESPQSRAVLRPLLPSLGNLIHDRVQRVRLAAVRMLLAVKKIPGIRFYHVVPVDHLNARLVEEGRLSRTQNNLVAKELTALMLNSYFPHGSNVSGTDQLKRTLTFLMSEPNASAVFYANLSAHLPVDAVAKFIAMLLSCVSSAVKVDQAKQIEVSKVRKKRRRHGSEEEPSEADGEALSASNTPLMATLAETICVLWESIASQLVSPEHHDCNELLIQSMSEVELPNILAHFEQKALDNIAGHDTTAVLCEDSVRICTSILRCAGQLPLEAIDGIHPHIISSLASVSGSDVGGFELLQRRRVSAHVALLCTWGMAHEVVTSLCASVELGGEDVVIMASPDSFQEHSDRSNTTKTRRNRSSRQSSRRGRGSSQKCVVPTIPPRIAWGALGDILRGSEPSHLAARKAIIASAEATEALETALERGTIVAEQILLADSGLGRSYRESEVESVLCACELYGRFALHREACTNSTVGFSQQAKLLLAWTTEKVIPALKMVQPGETELRKLDLSCILNTSDSLIIPSSPISPPRQKANLRGTPGRSHDSSMCEGDGVLNEPAVFLVSAMAASLLQSSCIVFSEWIAVGGGAASQIAEAAVGWCSIFEDDEFATDAQRGLFPAFARLATQLCRISNSFQLLKKLLVTCNEALVDDKLARQTLAAAISVAPSQRPQRRKEMVTTVLDAAHCLLDGEAETEVDFPTSIDELWNQHKGAIGPAISAIMINQQTRTELVRVLVSRFQQSSGESEVQNFEAKLLWLIIDSAQNTDEYTEVIRSLNGEHLNEGVRRNIVDKLLEAVA